MPEDELSIVLDSSRYLTGIAVSGYSGADVDMDGVTEYQNLEKSNTLSLVNIDDLPGNMNGGYIIWKFEI